MSTSAKPGPVLAVLIGAVLVYTALETMLTPALPTIQHGIGATTAEVAWVLTGVLLAGAVCTPLVGRLADLHDKRPILLGVLLTVCLGALVSAVSPSIVGLAAGQVLQGAGLSLVPLALGILRHTQSPERVKKASGMLVGASAFSVGLGLAGTGLIVGSLPYNWLFWFPLMLLVVITVVAWRIVPPCPPAKQGTVDWLGAATLSAGLFALLFGISQAPYWGWSSLGFVALVITAAVLLAVFVAVELRTPEPLVDLHLGGRAVLVACVMAGVLGYTTTASFLMIPILASAPVSTGYGLGAAAGAIGAILIPGTVLGAVAAAFVPRLERLVGAKTVMIVAAAATLTSTVLLLMASGNGVLLAVSATVAGLGIGLGMTQAMNLVVVSVPEERIASVSGLGWVLRSVGGTIGGQLSGSLLAGSAVPPWSAFTTAMWLDAAVAVVAVVGGIALRSRRIAVEPGPSLRRA
ncbi:MFS transporter [Kutzneria sp. NPDC052558]|uniref:MFS transporter n=1 Tax=Kutzneria sp. NPDC052558 TaxID=3364121 RepID=UPI0037CB0506